MEPKDGGPVRDLSAHILGAALIAAETERDQLRAELERAAAEPVATVCLVTDRSAHGHCIEVQLQVAPDTQLPIGTKLYTATPPAPVAEMRKPTPEECERISMAYYDDEGLVDRDHRHLGRDMFDAVRDTMWPKGGES